MKKELKTEMVKLAEKLQEDVKYAIESGNKEESDELFIIYIIERMQKTTRKLGKIKLTISKEKMEEDTPELPMETEEKQKKK